MSVTPALSGVSGVEESEAFLLASSLDCRGLSLAYLTSFTHVGQGLMRTSFRLKPSTRMKQVW